MLGIQPSVLHQPALGDFSPLQALVTGVGQILSRAVFVDIHISWNVKKDLYLERVPEF